ncbi:GIY-YIG nuclease family protein [Chloroflexota bacterium]
MSAKRNCYNYNLWDGRKKVYEGISNDPVRRIDEHDQDKKFTKMNVEKPAVSRDTALKREQEAIERYRRSHGGRSPKYND